MTRPEQDPTRAGGERQQAAPASPPEQRGASAPLPSVTLPKGGGAIRGIGEKFAANPATGTCSLTVPLAISPGRSGFGPQLSLSYDSGSGNGPFGFGWSLSVPAVTRKTDKGLPQYRDGEDSDVFVLSGSEDLVPVLVEKADGRWVPEELPTRTVAGAGYEVRRYRPRVEGLFARIERWTSTSDRTEVFWRSITKDNVTSWYGRTPESRISDPDDDRHVFSWLLCQTHDDKGNVVVYGYKEEDSDRVFEDSLGQPVVKAHERNRSAESRRVQRYLKRIRYGNRTPYLPVLAEVGPWPEPAGSTVAEAADDWLFEVVLDYGEHDESRPSPRESGVWPARVDPFSSYRSGFEVRTYRTCRRVLVFHHVPDDDDEVGADCLVRSTDLHYSDEVDPAGVRQPVHTFLRTVTQTGYRRDGARYVARSLPALELEYSEPVVQSVVEEVDPASLDNLPVGLDGSLYRWSDVHGEGIPGILTEQAGAWHYKRNLSPVPDRMPDGSELVRARFAPLETVALTPRALLADGPDLMDLAGDGLPDVVVLGEPVPGIYEHDDAEGWQRFRPFRSLPTRDLRDPSVRLVDLDGDGQADVLLTEDDALVWHPSLGEDGFGPSHRVALALDEEAGPRVVFADQTQSVYLADLSGDGLTDIVRVRNGEVCYWPNLGYGRFGAKVTTDDAPWFDHPDQFDQRRIRLADIDGSGTTDILYLHRDGVRLYFNQSGNGWSTAHQFPAFPHVDDAVAITPVDLLGNGTACLVWSSPLRVDGRRQMRYVDLMGRSKPHLLVRVVNNLGADTRIEYTSSTRHYLTDKRDGRPWVTRLPFPVHVVAKVTTYDHVSRSRFVSRYAYHHGHFDGDEREFRGFGMVEQWDTEELGALAGGEVPAGNAAPESHVPPVHTKTWFHTGVHSGRGHVSDYFAGLLDDWDTGEYFREPGLSDADARARLLPDTVLLDNLSPDEEREACRALKGSMLRQEVYADDAGPEVPPDQLARAGTPYTVTELTFSVRMVQPRGDNEHAVFFCHPREELAYHYERDPADPRLQHTLTLEVDEVGNVLKQAAVGYGRRGQVRIVDGQGRAREVPNPGLATLDPADREKQTTTRVSYTDSRFTNAVVDADTYRLPLPCEAVTYELTGHASSGPDGRFQPSDIVEPDEPAHPDRLRQRVVEDVPYEGTPTADPSRRPIEHLRSLYRSDDLDGLLELGMLHGRALPGESYRLAFTPGLLDQVLRRPRAGHPDETLVPNPAAVLGVQSADGGGYLRGASLMAEGLFPDGDADDLWWAPSGRTFFAEEDLAAEAELAAARDHFFLPRRRRDAFGHDAVVRYDDLDLLVVEARDAVGNTVAVERNDYRVLQPRLVRDPNRNLTEVAFDALGLVVGTAVMGKGDEADSLAGFVPDLDEGRVDGFFGAGDVHSAAGGLLLDASTRTVYDLHRFRRTRAASPDDPEAWQPACAATIARETHARVAVPPQGLRLQLGFSYSDGFGREIQRKAQAEAGALDPDDPQAATAPSRWVTSGWTIFNNKGKPVRQYEPFFSATPAFEFGVQRGVSPVLFYDPVGRVVATLHPDQTYEKVVFDPWQQVTYDANDTLGVRGRETGDPRTDPDVGGYVAAYVAAEAAGRPEGWQTWHAQRAGGGMGPRAAEAAAKAAAHADTPSTAHLDALGRPFLTVMRNRVACADHDLDGTDESIAVRVLLDIEGNEREVIDERRLPVDHLPTGSVEGRTVITYAYDMLGHRIHQSSMESGPRWMLSDVAGKPIRAWDGRGHVVTSAYDALRRPTNQTVEGTWAESDPRTVGAARVVDRIEYGEDVDGAEELNLRTRVYRHFDAAGVVVRARLDDQDEPTEAYDFKGNALHSTRRLLRDHAAVPDWGQDPALQDERFEGSTRYDALSRPAQVVPPHSDLDRAAKHVVQQVFNAGNLLERVDVWLETDEPDALVDPAASAPSRAGLANVDYDAKGRRLRVQHKNGATIHYRYDPLSFRLVGVYTERGPAFTEDADNQSPPPATVAAPPSPPDDRTAGLQHLGYTYDAAGNVTHVLDAAQPTLFFRNKRVEPSRDYTYDALYRLVRATGREHLGQGNGSPPAYSHDDAERVRLASGDAGGRFAAQDGNAMGTYVERYVYDAVGNLLQMQHVGSDPVLPGWTRRYDYDEESRLEDGKQGNRLSGTTVGNRPAERYQYDAHGSMASLPHLGDGAAPNLQWDWLDRLREVDLGGGGSVHHVYDASGQRVRKVWEKAPGLVEERIYLGASEIHRTHSSPIGPGSVTLERETLHVMDDRRRVALVETRTLDTDGNDPAPRQLVRYHYGDHLDSVGLELDDRAQVISYEEYAPYGSTTYQAVRSQTETPKRYRYTGKERDEETGLSYHQARYYAPWLGRWVAADPQGLRDGVNLYAYVRGRPVNSSDPTGTQSKPPADVIDETIKRLNEIDEAWQVQGKVGLREQALTMDIDELNPVGEKGLSKAEARARAVDPANRQLLDPMTNRQTKHLGIDPRSAAATPRAPVSVTTDPNTLITRRFSEVTEMKEIFDEAVKKISDPGKLSPTELKNRINSNVWDIIKNGKSESAAKVRSALEHLGFENVPGRGYAMKAVEMPAQAQAGAKSIAGSRPHQFVKWGGRILLVVGIGLDAVEIYHAENKPKTVTKKLGAWAGAWAGGKAGMWAGARVGAGVALVAGQAGPQAAAPEEIVTVPAGSVLGGFIGGIGGAIGGAWAGGEVTETIYEWSFEKR